MKSISLEQRSESKQADSSLNDYWVLRRFTPKPELETMNKVFVQTWAHEGGCREKRRNENQNIFHVVLYPDSMTTKLRVVFDDSCVTSTGGS